MEQTSNIVTGPRFQIRLEDLRDWHAIEVTCFVCSHRGHLHSPWLRQHWSLNTRLVDLERKFVCGRCGNRTANTWQIVTLGRNA